MQATGSAKAATAMVCGLLIISLSVNLASIASVSRLTWAWSRDGALPLWFSYVCITLSPPMIDVANHCHTDQFKAPGVRPRAVASRCHGDGICTPQYPQHCGLWCVHSNGFSRFILVLFDCHWMHAVRSPFEGSCPIRRLETRTLGCPRQHLRNNLQRVYLSFSVVFFGSTSYRCKHELCTTYFRLLGHCARVYMGFLG